MLWLLNKDKVSTSKDIKMFQEDISLYHNDNEVDDNLYDYEYNIYDVTPDVSIDFVSFTTEESEGKNIIFFNLLMYQLTIDSLSSH